MFEQKEFEGTKYLSYKMDFEPDTIAINTIGYTRPGFLLPFKRVEGELGYEIPDSCDKLSLMTRPIAAADFLCLVDNILRPLMDCDDYFLDYRNFYLNNNHIYISLHDFSVKYIYIPALGHICENEQVTRNLINIIRVIKISDDVYVKLRFLEELPDDSTLSDIKAVLDAIQAGRELPISEVLCPEPVHMLDKQDDNAWGGGTSQPLEDTVLLVVPESVSLPTKKVSSSLEDTVVLPENPLSYNTDALVNDSILHTSSAIEETVFLEENISAEPEMVESDSNDCSTVLLGFESGADGAASKKGLPAAPFLECVGNTAGLPSRIEIVLVDNAFRIGRIDRARPRKNDFEFPQTDRTKMVSRTHAVIQFEQHQFNIVDQKSSHGTFVNMSKITPGVPYPLQSGDLISFSSQGVDYRFHYQELF